MPCFMAYLVRPTNTVCSDRSVKPGAAENENPLRRGKSSQTPTPNSQFPTPNSPKVGRVYWELGVGARSWRAGFNLPRKQPRAEPHLPLVCLGAGDLGITSQRIHGAVGIQPHARDVGAGIVEMRRIRRVERLRAELNLQVPNPDSRNSPRSRFTTPVLAACSVHYCHTARP